MSAIERNNAAFDEFLRTLAHGCVDFEQLAGWYFDQKSELAALRAKVEAQAKQIETMRATLVHARSLAGIIAADDNWEGNTWKGESRPTAAALAVVDEAIAVLPSGPTGSVLVPRERLREIEWAIPIQDMGSREWHECCPACHGIKGNGHMPDCWLGKAIGTKESE